MNTPIPISQLQSHRGDLSRRQIACHPDNVAALRSALTARSFTTGSDFDKALLFARNASAFVDIYESPMLPKVQSTGWIIMPGGFRRRRAGFVMSWRKYWTIEEENLEWAIGLGIVREEVVPVFYIMDGWMPRFMLTDRFSMSSRDPRCMMTNYTA
jgi:hypothetical protein